MKLFFASMILTLCVIVLIVAILMLSTPRFKPDDEIVDLRAFPDGSIVTIGYEGSYMTAIISTFTRSEWNHVAILSDGRVYEAATHMTKLGKAGVIDMPIDDWIKLNEGCKFAAMAFTRSNSTTAMRIREIHEKLSHLSLRLDLYMWTPLIVGCDRSEDNETYCAKYVRAVLHELGVVSDSESPDLLLPKTYATRGNKELLMAYRQAKIGYFV